MNWVGGSTPHNSNPGQIVDEILNTFNERMFHSSKYTARQLGGDASVWMTLLTNVI